jgi:hypothetical protein
VNTPVPRYDKYEPFAGGFRAPLLAAVVSANGFVAYGVGLDSSGRVVLGAGNTGVIGLFIAHGAKAAGDFVDVMTDGEAVDFTGLTAGTVYYANGTTGALETSAPAAGANKTRIGQTVEATRMVVRVDPGYQG